MARREGFEALAESRAQRWSWVDGNAQREPALLLYAKAAPGAETTEVEKRITRRQPQTNKTLKEIVLEGLELRGGFRAVVVEEGGQSKEVLPAVPYGDVAVKKAAAAAKKLAEADARRAFCGGVSSAFIASILYQLDVIFRGWRLYSEGASEGVSEGVTPLPNLSLGAFPPLRTPLLRTPRQRTFCHLPFLREYDRGGGGGGSLVCLGDLLLVPRKDRCEVLGVDRKME